MSKKLLLITGVIFLSSCAATNIQELGDKFLDLINPSDAAAEVADLSEPVLVLSAERGKFTEEELSSIGELQTDYARINNAFGQIAVAKYNLDLQEDAVKNDLQETRQKEQNILNTITEKYGPGQLDPATGVFTPVEESDDEDSE